MVYTPEQSAKELRDILQLLDLFLVTFASVQQKANVTTENIAVTQYRNFERKKIVGDEVSGILTRMHEKKSA